MNWANGNAIDKSAPLRLILVANLTPISAMIRYRQTRPVSWIKAARKDFEAFPVGAQRDILTALTIAADGGFASSANPLKGLGAGVYEIALRHRSDAFRAVYTVQFAGALWVIHAFQKKSKSGIKTPQQEIDLITDRIRRLREALA